MCLVSLGHVERLQKCKRIRIFASCFGGLLRRIMLLAPTALGWWREPGRAATSFDIGFLLLAAVALSCGKSICGQEPAEDLVLVINSVTHPTFYFPGSNRIANIVGFAASWIPDVGANYHFQVFLRLFFAIVWPYLAFRLVMKPRYCLVATLIFHAIVLNQFDGVAISVVYSSVNPYSTSLFFLMLSLLVLKRSLQERSHLNIAGALVGFALAITASAVAPTNTIYALLMFGIYGVLSALPKANFALCRPWHPLLWKGAIQSVVASKAWRPYGIVAGLFGLAVFLAARHGSFYAAAYPEAVRSFSSHSYTRFRINLSGPVQSGINLWQVTGGFTLLFELAVFGFMVASLHHCRARQRAPVVDDSWLIAALGSGFLYVLIVSQLFHVQQNGYHFRYFIVVALCLVFVVVVKGFDALGLAVSSFGTRIRRSAYRPLAWCGSSAALLFALAAGLHSFGTPTTNCPLSNTEHMKSGLLASKEGYFAILGSYWDVWPSVFNAWKATADQPIERKVMPTGWRAETLDPKVSNEAVVRLLRDGSLKMLCVGSGRLALDFNRITDCVQTAEWNRDWGVLPPVGTFTETPNQLGAGFADVTMTLPRLQIGQRLNFRAAAHPEVLLSGWSKPEAFGTWTQGTDARMAFVLKCDQPTDVLLKLDMETWIGAITRDPEPLDVDVLFNDNRAFGWRYAKKLVDLSQSGTVPREWILCDRPNVIGLKIRNPRNPRQTGVSPDKRMLGIAVKSMTLTPLDRKQ